MPKDKDPHFLGHRQRLRERFQRNTAEGLNDYELLELLLTYAIPRRDVKPLAKSLISRFGSFSAVFDADPLYLKALPNMGTSSAVLIQLVKEILCFYHAEKMQKGNFLQSPSEVVEFARARLVGLPFEAFLVIFLNTQNNVINFKTIHEGTVDHAVVYPRKIIEFALQCNASGMILIHNHPSGAVDPSPEDIHLTKTLVHIGQAMDIRVLDHIVVGRQGYYSFTEHNLLSV